MDDGRLTHLVDNIIIYLRAMGIVSGPLSDPVPETPLRPWPASTGGGYNIASAVPKDSKVHLVQTVRGGIEFYEKIRPIFEQAYDEIGLGWKAAVSLDTTLYFKCAARGASEETVDNFLDFCERRGMGVVVLSLDELMDVEDEAEPEFKPLDMVPLDEQALREVNKWGLREARRPTDTRRPIAAKIPTEHECRRVSAGRVLRCDKCDKNTDYLVLTTSTRTPEICGKCLPGYNEERVARGKRPVYAGERMVYT